MIKMKSQSGCCVFKHSNHFVSNKEEGEFLNSEEGQELLAEAIASAILGILISLKTEKTKSTEEHYIFIFTITSIGLGILSGLILLFSEVTVFSLFESKKKEQILQLLDGKERVIDSVKIPKIYTFLKYFCFFSFFCSLILLIIFAILSDS